MATVTRVTPKFPGDHRLNYEIASDTTVTVAHALTGQPVSVPKWSASQPSKSFQYGFDDYAVTVRTDAGIAYCKNPWRGGSEFFTRAEATRYIEQAEEGGLPNLDTTP